MRQLLHLAAFSKLFVVMGAQAKMAIADYLLRYKINLATGPSLPFQAADLTFFGCANNGNPTLSGPQTGNMFYNYSPMQSMRSLVETEGYSTIKATPATAEISDPANGLPY
jgi:hypothetical protein